MPLGKKLLAVLACPKCKGSLQLVDSDTAFLCAVCKLKFHLRDGVPNFNLTDAESLTSRSIVVDKEFVSRPVIFRVISGANKGMKFTVEKGTCRAIGRSSEDPNKTSVFSVDFTLTLDDSTKNLIINYVTRQFKVMRDKESGVDQAGKSFGKFKRSSDVILADHNLSRLHTMIFYDGDRVGVLDLVSKNGTHINGKEIESHVLGLGDLIEIGETKIMREEG